MIWKFYFFLCEINSNDGRLRKLFNRGKDTLRGAFTSDEFITCWEGVFRGLKWFKFNGICNVDAVQDIYSFCGFIALILFYCLRLWDFCP